MHLTILSVGKIKESYYREALGEYARRLRRYCTLSFLEVQDEPAPQDMSPREETLALEKEGKRLLSALPAGAYCFALAIEGRKMDSLSFARSLETLGKGGISDVAFVIGGSLGLHPDVKARANERLSFSDMTFPHSLMRVILAEQIYRAFRIIRGEPYHK